MRLKQTACLCRLSRTVAAEEIPMWAYILVHLDEVYKRLWSLVFWWSLKLYCIWDCTVNFVQYSRTFFKNSCHAFFTFLTLFSKFQPQRFLRLRVVDCFTVKGQRQRNFCAIVRMEFNRYVSVCECDSWWNTIRRECSVSRQISNVDSAPWLHPARDICRGATEASQWSITVTARDRPISCHPGM